MTDDELEQTVEKVRSFLQAKREELGNWDESEYADALDNWLFQRDVRICLENLTGLTLLGTGSFRIVFALDEKRVLKIEYTRHDTLEENFAGQNAIEIKAWNQADDDLRSKLAPVLEHGKDWLIMARTQPIHEDFQEEETAHLEKFILDTNQLFANSGLYDGRVVLHDYGFLLPFLSKDRSIW